MIADDVEKMPEAEQIEVSEPLVSKAVDKRLAAMAETGDIADPHYSPHFRRSAELMLEWEKFDGDPTARRYLLDRVGREMMEAYGTPPDQLLDSKLPENVHGVHAETDATTKINEEVLKESDPRKALETYLHEYRHTVQDAEIAASKGAMSHTVDPERVRELSRPYVDPPNETTPPERARQQFEDYRDQFKETDARVFSERLADNILKVRDVLREMRVEPRSDADRAVETRLAREQTESGKKT